MKVFIEKIFEVRESGLNFVQFSPDKSQILFFLGLFEKKTCFLKPYVLTQFSLRFLLKKVSMWQA